MSTSLVLARVRPTDAHPWLRRLLLGVFFPLLMALAVGLVWLRASLPPSSLRLTQGVSSPVTLVRDAQGVPHIRAASEADAYFAVGYAHAQDRLWQMEMQRRMAQGRLSEVLGRKSLDTDVWFRVMGLPAAAATAWPHLSAPAQRSLEAYAAGVNAWLGERHPLPIEFRVLGIEPQAWSPVDSLTVMKAFALNLGGNAMREMRFLAGCRVLDEDRLRTLGLRERCDTDIGLSSPSPSSVADLGRMADLQQRWQQVQRQWGLSFPETGSNAWVVAGRHVRDGGPLLANDPHMGLGMPSAWYAVSLRAQGLAVSGMSLPGLPLVIFGRNAHIAWGGTNLMADTQDLFLERADRAGDRYATPDGWRPFQHRQEVIQVRPDMPAWLHEDYAPLRLTVRSTRHGPVLSDQAQAFDQPLALRWTGFDPDDTSYEAFYRLAGARDWREFGDAAAWLVAPALNLLYADRAGHIGHLVAGRIPVRAQGNGQLPVPGWNDDWAWVGTLAARDLPRSFDPASGIIVNANNDITPDGYRPFLSLDWASPARARRIESLLRQHIDAGQPMSIDDMAALQSDTLDLDAAALMAVLRARWPRPTPGDPSADHLADAEALLGRWQGEMAADSGGAALFHAWMRHLREALFVEQLRPGQPRALADWLAGLGREVSLSTLTTVLQAPRNPWCAWPRGSGRGSATAQEPVQASSPMPNCETLLTRSLEQALREMRQLQGTWSMADWTWGRVHHTRYAHLPFGQWKPLSLLFDRRIDAGGSVNSVNAAGAHYSGADGYLQDFGAGFRQIMLLRADRTLHAYMNSTGQSGNVMSPHYDDMVQRFHDARWVLLDAYPSREDGALDD